MRPPIAEFWQLVLCPLLLSQTMSKIGNMKILRFFQKSQLYREWEFFSPKHQKALERFCLTHEIKFKKIQLKGNVIYWKYMFHC